MIPRGGRAGSWPGALAELLLIVAGVLIALGVDSWREERRDATLSRTYMERLEEDLVADSASYWFDLTLLRVKVHGLETLRGLIETGRLPDTLTVEGFIGPLFVTRFQGTAQPASATFDELVSTGRLELIPSADLRASLLEYYALFEFRRRFLDNQYSEYSAVMSPLVPGEIGYDWRVEHFRGGRGGDGTPVPTQAAATLLQNLRGSDRLPGAINAELGYAALMREGLVELDGRTADLLEAVRAVRAEQ